MPFVLNVTEFAPSYDAPAVISVLVNSRELYLFITIVFSWYYMNIFNDYKPLGITDGGLE